MARKGIFAFGQVGRTVHGGAQVTIEVAAPLLKSDKLSNLQLRPSALDELAEMHSRGTITQADIEVILKEATENWIGAKRLGEILRSRHPIEAPPKITAEAEPEASGEIPGDPATGEAIDKVTSTEGAGEATDEAGDGG